MANALPEEQGLKGLAKSWRKTHRQMLMEWYSDQRAKVWRWMQLGIVVIGVFAGILFLHNVSGEPILSSIAETRFIFIYLFCCLLLFQMSFLAHPIKWYSESRWYLYRLLIFFLIWCFACIVELFLMDAPQVRVVFLVVFFLGILFEIKFKQDEVNEKSKSLQNKGYSQYASSLNGLGLLYYCMGEYQAAEPIYLEAKGFIERSLGKTHPDYSSNIQELTELYKSMGKYSNAERLYNEARQIALKEKGKEDPDYAILTNSLADLYKTTGKSEKAEELYLEVKEIQEGLGEGILYAASLNSLASLYSDTQRYSAAEEFYLEALSTQEKTLGKEHPDYAVSIHKLGQLYHIMGKYKQVENYYLLCQEIREKILGQEHPDYALILSDIARFYQTIGRYENAKNLYEKAQHIIEETLTTDHPAYTATLNGLATLGRIFGHYGKAQELYLEVKEIHDKVLGKDSPEYAIALRGLANIHLVLGEYAKAEPLFLEALGNRERVLGKKHPEYLISLIDTAKLYLKTGEESKAELLFLDAKETIEEILDATHPIYGKAIMGLAEIHRRRQEFILAEELYLEGEDILSAKLGQEHYQYAQLLNSLGILCQDRNEYSKAKALHEEAQRLLRETLGKGHPEYGLTLFHLAKINEQEENFREAEALYQEVILLREELFGPQHLFTQKTLKELASMQENQNHFPAALAIYQKLKEILRETTGTEDAAYLSILEQEARVYKKLGEEEKAYTLCEEIGESSQRVFGKEHPKYAYFQTRLAFFLAKKGEKNKALETLLSIAHIYPKEIFRLAMTQKNSDLIHYRKESLLQLSAIISLFREENPKNEAASRKIFSLVLEYKSLFRKIFAPFQEEKRLSSFPHLKKNFSNLKNVYEELTDLNLRGPQEMDRETYQQRLEDLKQHQEFLETELSSQVFSLEREEWVGQTTPKDIASRLPKASVLVEYFQFTSWNFEREEYGSQYYLAWVIPAQKKDQKKDLCLWFDLGESQKIDLSFNKYQESKGKEKGTELYERLISPLQEKISSKHLILCPDGSLHLIPFAALFSPKEKFLIEENKLSYLSSAKDLLYFASEKRPYKQKPLVAASSSLAGSGEEAVIVGSMLFASHLLNQSSISKEKLLAYNSPAFIHLISSSVIEKYKREGLGQSSLLLQEEESINTSEISQMQLQGTEFVFLSTYFPDILERPQLFPEIYQSFLVAGTEQVLLNSGQPEDNSSLMEMISEFYRKILRGKKKILALQEIQREFLEKLRQEGQEPPCDFWGKLICVGNPHL